MLSVAVNAILTLVVPVVAAPPAILMVPLIGASVSPDNKTIESLVTVETLPPASLNLSHIHN